MVGNNQLQDKDGVKCRVEVEENQQIEGQEGKVAELLQNTTVENNKGVVGGACRNSDCACRQMY